MPLDAPTTWPPARQVDAAELTAVIVTYRRVDSLRTTLGLIRQQTLAPGRIVVVDNDPDFSARAVVDPDTAYWPTGENIGPAGAISWAIDRLLAENPPRWIMLVDDDDPPDSLDLVTHLFGFAHSCPGADTLGAVGLVGARYDRQLGRVVRVPDRELRGPVQVDYLGGGQYPIYRAEALRTRHGYGGDLFFGFDDLALGLGLSKAGWHLCVDGEAWSARRTAAGRLNLDPAALRRANVQAPWRAYYATRNQILISQQFGRRPLVHSVTRGFGRTGRSLLQGNLRLAMHELRGTADGVLRRDGRRVEPEVAKSRTHSASRFRRAV